MSTLGPAGGEDTWYIKSGLTRRGPQPRDRATLLQYQQRLASQHAKLIETMHLVPLHERERERERGSTNQGANAYVCSIFPYSIGHLPR